MTLAASMPMTSPRPSEPPHRFPLPRIGRTTEALILWIVVVCASVRRLVQDVRQDILFDRASGLYYQASTIGFNYFQFGAVRRGLGGSIAYLLDHDLQTAAIKWQVFSAACLGAGACWLYRRLDAPLTARIAFAAVLVGIVLRYGDDPARTDMSVIALLALSTIAMSRGRLAMATAAVCFGVFIHEAAFMFGLPLLAALVVRAGGVAAFSRRQWVGAIGFVAATLMLYGSMPYLPHLDRQAMVDLVRSKMPADRQVDWALYAALGGLRGVRTAICQNANDPTYWRHPVGGLLALGAAYLACSTVVRREWRTVALAALPGFAVLSVIATDASRWTMLAVANLWLLQVVTVRSEPVVDVRPLLKLACAAVFGIVVNPLVAPSIEYPVFFGSPVFERVVRAYSGGHTLGVQDALDTCDRDWLDVLGVERIVDP